MNPNIRAYKRSQYIISAVIIILGLLMSLFGWLLVDMMGWILAIAFIVFGVSLALKSIFAAKYEGFSCLRFISAIIIFATGMFCFFNPTAIIHFAICIAGICVLTVAIDNLFKFVKYKDDKNYLSFEFIKYCLNFAFGFFLLFSPGWTLEFILFIFGVFLIYLGITFAIETHNAQIYLG